MKSHSAAAPTPIADARPETAGAVHCPHFGPCGGCSFLDQPYADELAVKAEAFGRVAAAHLDLAGVALRPPLAARAPLFYRTSLKVPFALRRARPVAGFYRRASHEVVDLESCAIQHPRLTQLLLLAKECVRELGTPIHDERSHKGLLRHFLARVASDTGACLAGFVVRYDRDRATRKLAERLLERAAPLGLVGVIENVNRERGSQVLGHESRLLAGRETLRETSDGLVLETSLTTFAQVNAAQASVLYGEVERLLGPLAGQGVVDLFSGYGPIALRLARRGARVHAIEYDARAVAEGRAAAAANGLAGTLTYAAGDAQRLLREHAAGPAPIDAIVVDPPRRGLSRALVELLCTLSVPRLVVVSCFPDTLVRDLGLLSRTYALRELGTVDLFPRTPHLESFALLERR
ncbi:MAG TPA: 23S rRNA (uracil(1939)-C(5))-methyltransferase RlmD [Planctomycetota bacterium]